MPGGAGADRRRLGVATHDSSGPHASSRIVGHASAVESVALEPTALLAFAATFLLDQGEELRTVMELLGHSTIRMTADTYGHVLPSRARNAAERHRPGAGRDGGGVTL